MVREESPRKFEIVKFSRSEFKALLGSYILHFLHRPEDHTDSSVLDFDLICRLGLQLSISDTDSHDKYQEQEWIIAKIMLANLDKPTIRTGTTYFYGAGKDGRLTPLPQC